MEPSPRFRSRAEELYYRSLHGFTSPFSHASGPMHQSAPPHFNASWRPMYGPSGPNPNQSATFTNHNPSFRGHEAGEGNEQGSLDFETSLKNLNINPSDPETIRIRSSAPANSTREQGLQVLKSLGVRTVRSEDHSHLGLTPELLELKLRLDESKKTMSKKPLGLMPIYANVPDVPRNLNEVEFDFPDSYFFNEASYTIYRDDDPASVAEMGRNTLPMLASGFSPKGVAHIFQLAYNLRDPRDLRLFVLDEIPAHLEDVSIRSLSDIPNVSPIQYVPNRPTSNVLLEAAGYSFMAASILRMFTKSEENYSRAFDHIKLGFCKFYKRPLPFATPAPTAEALRSLNHSFQNSLHTRVALYRILYSSKDNRCLGLRSFLYEQHLTNMGLHIIGIFIQLCVKLNCPSGVLLTALHSWDNRKPLFALAQVMALNGRRDADHERKMWKFGRIFNENFMSTLQTKNCVDLTYTLAYALKIVQFNGNENILKIVQFSGMNPEKKMRCEYVADSLVEMIQREMNQDHIDSVSN